MRRPVNTVVYLGDVPRTGTNVDFRTWITIPRAAKLLGVTPSTVYEMVRAEKLAAIDTPQGRLVHIQAVGAERHRRINTGKLRNVPPADNTKGQVFEGGEL